MVFKQPTLTSHFRGLRVQDPVPADRAPGETSPPGLQTAAVSVCSSNQEALILNLHWNCFHDFNSFCYYKHT